MEERKHYSEEEHSDRGDVKQQKLKEAEGLTVSEQQMALQELKFGGCSRGCCHWLLVNQTWALTMVQKPSPKSPLKEPWF